MKKLRVLSGKDICAILENHGFQNVRQKRQSHYHATKNRHKYCDCTCAKSTEIKIGSLQSIIRQSKLAREFFES